MNTRVTSCIIETTLVIHVVVEFLKVCRFTLQDDTERHNIVDLLVWKRWRSCCLTFQDPDYQDFQKCALLVLGLSLGLGLVSSCLTEGRALGSDSMKFVLYADHVPSTSLHYKTLPLSSFLLSLPPHASFLLLSPLFPLCLHCRLCFLVTLTCGSLS